jgi:hypothetical protein
MDPICLSEDLTLMVSFKFNSLYYLGCLCHHVLVVAAALLASAWIMRIKPIHLSSVVIAVLYGLDECWSIKSPLSCCSSMYYLDLGEQLIKVLPLLSAVLLTSTNFLGNFPQTYNYSKGYPFAFWQIFPSYFLTVFMVMHKYNRLAALIAYLLIAMSSSALPNNWIVKYLRRRLGHSAVCIAAISLNCVFGLMDVYVRTPLDVLKQFTVRQIWCVLACVEFEFACCEADLLANLHSDSALALMLKKAAEDPCLKLLPKSKRSRLFTILYRSLCFNFAYFSEATLVQLLHICLAEGANVNCKRMNYLYFLQNLFFNYKPRVLLLLDKFHFDYTRKLANGKTFIEMASETKDSSQANAAIYSFVRRRLNGVSFIVHAHRRQMLKGFDRLAPSVLAGSLRFL